MVDINEAGAYVERLFDKAQYVSELKDGDPLLAKAKMLGEAYSRHVQFLRTEVPNPTIRRLGALLWDVVGHRIVPVSIGPKVDSLSFLGMKRGPVMRACMIIPENWDKMCCSNPLLQMGAVVCNGSKALDAYNDMLDKNIEHRAYIYEAEFLLTLQRDVPEVQLNNYQKALIEKYPQGVGTPSASDILYTWKDFSPPPTA